MDLTYNDYFTTSGQGRYNWKVHLKQCTQSPSSYYEECIRAAKILGESADPLYLMFSGGIDGEFMINIFKDAKVDFKVAIISYGVYNEHDAKYAFEYCNANGITPEIIDLDLEEFITSGRMIEVAEEAKCCAYQMTSVMEGIKKIDGNVIMANGEPQVNKMPNGTWHWEETERINSYMNWYTLHNITGTPDFMRYTSEQTLSFLEEPLVKQLVNNELEQEYSVAIKQQLYSQHFTIEPRYKFTGWERLENSAFFEDNKVFESFAHLRDMYNGQYVLDYNDVCQQLRGT
jgi:hypothetical protein